MILSSRIAGVKPSPTLAITSRAKQMKASGIDVVNFAAGEPDWDTPDSIKEAAINAIKSGFTKYTPTSGLPELKQAILEKFQKDNQLTFKPEQIIVSSGAKHSLYNILQVIIDKADEVIIPSPYWVSYPEMVRLASGKPIILETEQNYNFKLKIESLENAITKKTKAIIINSPSNPTGSVYNKDELTEIAKICVAKKIYCVSDEIYEKLIYDRNSHVSIAALNSKIYDLTFTVNGASKAFSMTGWRIGYLGGPLEAVSAISRLQDHSTSCPSSISQKAVVAALKLDSSFINSMVDEFQNRRNYIMQRLNNFGLISYIKPAGAFYIFCNVSKMKLSSDEFCRRLLEEIWIAAIPGKEFGNDRYVRFSFATSMTDIKKGIDRLEDWLNKKF